jgi:hypothetical protein
VIKIISFNLVHAITGTYKCTITTRKLKQTLLKEQGSIIELSHQLPSSSCWYISICLTFSPPKPKSDAAVDHHLAQKGTDHFYLDVSAVVLHALVECISHLPNRQNCSKPADP